jgi:hypothetical protein
MPGGIARADEVLPDFLVLYRHALAVAHHHQAFGQIARPRLADRAGRPGALDHQLRIVIHLDDDLERHIGIALGLLAPVDVAVNVVDFPSIETERHRLHDRGLAGAVHAADQEDAATIVADREDDLRRELEGLVVFEGELTESHRVFSVSAQIP